MRLLTSLVFGSIIGVTISLDCFHCHDCDKEAATIKTCHSPTSQCYSILGPITKRGCAHQCPYNSQIAEEECHMCSDDLCNHHQQGHFLHKAIHHRGRRHRRDKSSKPVVASTHYHQDGTRTEHFEDSNHAVPPLPRPRLPELPPINSDQSEDIIEMSKDDPLLGKIDTDGVAYLPVDPKTKEVLPEYRHLLEKYENSDLKEGNNLPNSLDVEETEIRTANGDKILEVKTENVVYPPGISKEDIVDEVDEGKILGAGIGLALPKDEDNYRPPSLPTIPEGDMPEEDAMKLAEQIEKLYEDEEREKNEDEEKGKPIAEQPKLEIGGGAVPSATTKKPNSSPSQRLFSILNSILLSLLLGLIF